jgi:Ca2+-binding RTX toxin-like protein
MATITGINPSGAVLAWNLSDDSVLKISDFFDDVTDASFKTENIGNQLIVSGVTPLGFFKKVVIDINGFIGTKATFTINGVTALTISGIQLNLVSSSDVDFEWITLLAGDDTISLADGSDYIHSYAGNDNVSGGNGSDSINGGFGDDSINSGDGPDSVKGDLGNDVINGGNGNDSIYGGDGNDTLNGENGNDLISGGNGDDSLSGGGGANTILGGTGNDIIRGSFGDSIDGGGGVDILYFEGSVIRFSYYTEDASTGLTLINSTGQELELKGIEYYEESLERSKLMLGTPSSESFQFENDISNKVFAGGGNDTIYASELTNRGFVSGGNGTDLIIFAYTLSKLGAKKVVSDLYIDIGSTRVVDDVETFRFSDGLTYSFTALKSLIKANEDTIYRSASVLQDKDGHFLFTANENESIIMKQFGWITSRNLTSFESADNNLGVSLHKFYYKPTNSFYYATDDQAKPVKQAFAGWDYQGASDFKVYTNSQVNSKVAPTGAVPVYQMWINGTGHVYTTDTKLVDTLMGQDINTDLLTANNVATSKGTYNGVVFWGDPAGANFGFSKPFTNLGVNVNRSVSTLQDKDGHFLFTANKTESEIMQQFGWTVATGLKPFESVDNANGVTLHKFYYPPTNSFYYATDDQAKAVKASFTGWDYQGATDLKVYTNAQYGAGTAPAGSVPIYQMWVNGKGHVYTSDTVLVDRLMGQDINTNILTANNVVTAVGTYNGVVFWGDPPG